MKKILVAAVLLFAGIASTFAGDRERPIAVDKMCIRDSPNALGEGSAYASQLEGNGLLGLLNVFSGGAFGNAAIFALGVIYGVIFFDSFIRSYSSQDK